MRMLVPQCCSRDNGWLDPLVTAATANVIFEATSRCNLRCTYCSVSQPDYVGTDMSDEHISLFVEGLKQRRPRMLNLSGHGETTIIPLWHEKFRQLIDEFPAGLTSNFAHLFSEAELQALCAFHSVNISLDTHDPELLARVRRKVKLETILQNLFNLRRKAAELGLSAPDVYVFCTVYDKNVLQLEDFARFLLPLKIKGVFWANLMKHDDVPDGLNVEILPLMSAELQLKAYESIKRATAVLQRSGVEVHLWGDYDYFGAMKSFLSSSAPPPDVVQLRDALANNSPQKGKIWRRSFVESCAEGQTRDCMQPWDYAHLEADGNVLPCCVTTASVGRVDREHSLAKVLNSRMAQRLRSNLLNGTLDSECLLCPVRKPIAIEEFRRRCIAANYAGDYRDRVPRGFAKRCAARLLSRTPAASLFRRLLLRVAASIFPLRGLEILAAGTHSELPLGLEHLFEVKNVKAGSVSLRERISFALDGLQTVPALLLFHNVALHSGDRIEVQAQLMSVDDAALKLSAVISDSRDRIVTADSTALSSECCRIRLSCGASEDACTLKLEISAVAGKADAAVVYIDYPVVHQASD